MIVKRLIPTKACETTTTTGETFSIEMPKSSRGIVQVTVNAGNANNSTVALLLYGRLTPTMDWVTISDGSQTLLTSTTWAAEDIQLFPEIRAVVVEQLQSPDSFTYAIELGC